MRHPTRTQSTKRQSSAVCNRDGMALLLVLLLISMTLGLSYAIVRSQYTAFQIQRNSDRRMFARQAAATGLTMALKKMHTADWAGADSTLSGRLGTYEGYEVTYATGDPSLSSGDTDYEDIPYRVTLLSTGMAADPDNPSNISKYQIRAVVRLVPRALGGEPAYWEDMTSYTIYQYKDNDVIVDMPVHIAGPVRIQKKLKLATGYDWHDDAKFRYLGDLNLMRIAGNPDWRPLGGPVYLDWANQDPETLALLSATMGVATVDTAQMSYNDFTHPGEVLTYQIYPKGKQYQAVTLTSDNQTNKTLEADVQTNPLGIFYRNGTVRLYDNVRVKGTIVVNGSGDLFIQGRNVSMSAVDMPPLAETDAVVQLPVAMLKDDMRMFGGAAATIEGLITVGDEFEIRTDVQYGMDLAMQGRIIAAKIIIRRREDWDMSAGWWGDRLAEFKDQEGNLGGIEYFPDWLGANWNRDPQPRLNIEPASRSIRYHWKNSFDPIYVPGADDEGLRWELLEWTESP